MSEATKRRWERFKRDHERAHALAVFFGCIALCVAFPFAYNLALGMFH